MREATPEMRRVKLLVPATYWDDFSERQPVDHPDQMPAEVSRAGSRVTIELDSRQAAFLIGDARFYAEGNVDDTPRAVIDGAKKVLSRVTSAFDRLQRY